MQAPGEARSGTLDFFPERPIRTLCAFALVALTLFAAPAQAAFPGANGKIAFTSHVDPNPPYSVWEPGEIYTMNPDGSGSTNITNNAAEDTVPDWSPDGTKILFDSDRSPAGIYVMNADGSNPTFLASGGSPAWSPDGRKIAFGGPMNGIYVMNADGSNPTFLANGFEPAWSPDGEKIAFVRSVTFRNDEIFVMNADGSGQTQLTTHSYRGSITPDWSPNGQKIAFYYTSDADCPCGGVSVMNADGTGMTLLTNETDETNSWDPSWSPDGQKITFSENKGFSLCSPDCDFEIYTINPDGSMRSGPLTVNTTEDVWPDWQPLNNPSLVKYETPASASSLRFSLVPLFKQCGVASNPVNGKHAPPLATGSCNPPAPSSPVARVGVASQGTTALTVSPGDGDPTNGDQANIAIVTTISDVQTPGGADYNPNASGADMTQVTRLRLTDRANLGGLPNSTTDLDFAVPVDCAATADPVLGSTCSVTTTSDTLLPGFAKEAKQTVIQAFRVRLYDAGQNGVRENGSGDDRIFAHQGIYIP